MNGTLIALLIVAGLVLGACIVARRRKKARSTLPPVFPTAVVPDDPLVLLQRAQRVLVLFAHPDDEILIAPLLPDLCAPGRHCRIVYLTQGKTGDCLRGLCEREPIETVRARELAGSAARHGFEHILADFPSVGGLPFDEQVAAWDRHAGGNVRAWIAAHAAAFRPDAVVTFDPRHGTTATPAEEKGGEHALLARLALDALAPLMPADRVVLLASVIAYEAGAIGFRPAFPDEPGSHTYPVAELWHHVTGLMRHYGSQFSEEWVAGAERAPEALRTISLQLASTQPKEAL